MPNQVIYRGYATPADVNIFGDWTSSTALDAKTRKLLYFAEKEVERYCGRSFVISTDTKEYEGDSTTILKVDDLISVTTLAIDDVAVDSSYIFLYPENVYPKDEIRLYDALFTKPIDDYQNISITGLWGYQHEAPTTGTADSGTTSTLVDDALTQVDDYWNDYMLTITAGTNAGETRCITDFVASSDTITIDASTPFLKAIDNTSVYAINRVPSDIRLATARIALNMARPRASGTIMDVRGERINELSVQYFSSQFKFIDAEIAEILDNYRLVSF